MNGELTVVDDVPAAFAARVIAAYERRPEDLFGFALSGGSTARPCYERLAADSADVIDWLSVNIYWGDERCVPPDHPDSNQLLGRQALLERRRRGQRRVSHELRGRPGRLPAAPG